MYVVLCEELKHSIIAYISSMVLGFIGTVRINNISIAEIKKIEIFR
jgi:predicted transcriptional regulator